MSAADDDEASAMDAARLAVGLSSHEDLEAAARSVGLTRYSGAELVELAKVARRHHRDLVEGKASATGALLANALSLSAIRLIEHSSSLPASLVSGAVNNATRSLSEFQGSAQRIFSQVEIGIAADYLTADELERRVNEGVEQRIVEEVERRLDEALEARVEAELAKLVDEEIARRRERQLAMQALEGDEVST